MFLAGLLLESLRLPWALEKAMHQFCDDDGDCAEYVHAADYVYDDGREPSMHFVDAEHARRKPL